MFELPMPTEKGSMSEYSGQYPIKDMILARKYLIDELYNRPAGTDFMMNVKKKIGILTPEVIEYFLEDKKPLGFVVDARPQVDAEGEDGSVRIAGEREFTEIPIDDGDVPSAVLAEKPASKANDQGPASNKYSYISRNPRDYKWVVGVFKDQQQQQQVKQEQQEPKSPSPADQHDQQHSRENQPPESVQSEKTPLIDPSIYIRQLNQQLNMTHACDRTFCPRSLPVVDSSRPAPGGEHEVLVCDFCHLSSHNKATMRAHLDSSGHMSASAFGLEGALSTDAAEPFSSFDKIKQLNKRSSVVSSAAREPNQQAYVFCPGCLFCFGQNIQACATHHECTHRQSDRIYSVAEPIDRKEITVYRRHSCTECAGVFKRLSDLSRHLKESQHMPGTKPGQLNLFKCPFNNCPFQSIDFCDFKTHLLHHKYFQEGADVLPEKSLKCTVLVFNRPAEYYHITDYNYQLKRDIDEQLSSIDQSVDSLKGHGTIAELLRLLRDKKEQLIRIKLA